METPPMSTFTVGVLVSDFNILEQYDNSPANEGS